MFTRFKQKIKEKTGSASQTRYSAEFEEKCRLLEESKDNTSKLAAKLVLATHGFGDPHTKNSRFDALSEVLRAFGQRLPSGTPYSATLTKTADTLSNIADQFRKQGEFTKHEVSAPLVDWTKGECSEMLKQRSVLQKRRLEMDAAVTKTHRGTGADEVAASRASSATAEHTAALATLEEMMDKMDAYFDNHRQRVEMYMASQCEFLTAVSTA